MQRLLGGRTGTAQLLGLRSAGLFRAASRLCRRPASPARRCVEFKQMVRALHQAGIEVILDVVFNHTAEGNEHGPTLSFKGLENRVYYMLDNGGGYYRNYSGCGNTVNGNHPIVREMIFLCLRHWVHELPRRRLPLRSGVDPQPRPQRRAGAQSAAGRNDRRRPAAWPTPRSSPRPGTPPGPIRSARSANLRWAEWNGRYRDDMRRFWRGDRGMVGQLATRLAGSSDLYRAERAAALSQHQLHHLARRLHAQRPGELSATSTTRPTAKGTATATTTTTATTTASKGRRAAAMSRRSACGRSRNLLATLLLSQGVPMLLSGDECRRTQRGNNNAYCQDNPDLLVRLELVETQCRSGAVRRRP